MDLLIKGVLKMVRQKGMATLLAIGLIVGAFAVGSWFQHFTEHVDHPVEQVAEDVLDGYGLDHDFSKDKKEKPSSKK